MSAASSNTGFYVPRLSRLTRVLSLKGLWRSILNGQEISVSLVYYGDSRLSDLDLGTDRGEHPIPFQSNGEQFPSCIYYSLTSLGPYFHAFGHPGGDARQQRASYAQHAPVPSRTSGVDDLGAG